MNFHAWNGYGVSTYTLGTVQLGQAYGVANTSGKPSKSQADAILDQSHAIGINCFDTAQHYGESEVILGDYFSRNPGRAPLIVTKLNPSLDPTKPGEIARAVDASLANLRTSRLWCLMIHNVEWLRLWDSGEFKVLLELKAQGKIAHLGASVYTVAQAEAALRNRDIEIVQVPCNAWDQGMRTQGIFSLAREMKKLCFIRSIYLQGLLTMAPEKVEQSLPIARAASRRWVDLCREMGMEPIELASRFALALSFPLVVGAETAQQVRDNGALLEKTPLSPDMLEWISREMDAVVSEDVRNPVKWNRKG